MGVTPVGIGRLWYQSPQDSPGNGYGEVLDPVCQNGSCTYLKPDTNLAVEPGTPITALLPGVVTDVSSRGVGNGGLSVTVKLDKPLNPLATHVSYNFLGSSNVAIGQTVNEGDTIGLAGSPTGINFALALGSDDAWGRGPGFQQNAKGNPLLDPRPLLQWAINGKAGVPSFNPPSGPSSSCAPWDIQCILNNFKVNFQGLGLRIVKGLLGVIMIIAGLFLMLKALAPGLASKAAKVAML